MAGGLSIVSAVNISPTTVENLKPYPENPPANATAAWPECRSTMKWASGEFVYMQMCPRTTEPRSVKKARIRVESSGVSVRWIVSRRLRWYAAALSIAPRLSTATSHISIPRFAAHNCQKPRLPRDAKLCQLSGLGLLCRDRRDRARGLKLKPPSLQLRWRHAGSHTGVPERRCDRSAAPSPSPARSIQ